MDPWVTAEVILENEAFCALDVEDEELIAKAEAEAGHASAILSLLSGNSITGLHTLTIWPESTSNDYQQDRILLAFPVVEVSEVVIAGEALADDEFSILDQTWLVLSPVDGSPRYFPTSLVNDGEFSITYTHGVECPSWATGAAAELGASLLRNSLGLGSPLPAGVTSVSRQGLNYSLGGQAQALKDGVTTETFPSVVRFLSLINPSGEMLPTYAWSPDLGYQLHSVAPGGTGA